MPEVFSNERLVRAMEMGSDGWRLDSADLIVLISKLGSYALCSVSQPLDYDVLLYQPKFDLLFESNDFSFKNS